MRVFSNSLMAALVVAALFLGNCFSCPQLLAAMAAHTPHECCHHKAPQPAAKTDCQSQALQHFVQAEKAAAPALAVAVIPAPLAVIIALQTSIELPHAPAPTPPDLISLNSSFRI